MHLGDRVHCCTRSVAVHRVAKVHDIPWDSMVHVILWNTMHILVCDSYRMVHDIPRYNMVLVIACNNMHSWHDMIFHAITCTLMHVAKVYVIPWKKMPNVHVIACNNMVHLIPWNIIPTAEGLVHTSYQLI